VSIGKHTIFLGINFTNFQCCPELSRADNCGGESGKDRVIENPIEPGGDSI